jgi:hypothetical protein
VAYPLKAKKFINQAAMQGDQIGFWALSLREIDYLVENRLIKSDA